MLVMQDKLVQTAEELQPSHRTVPLQVARNGAAFTARLSAHDSIQESERKHFWPLGRRPDDHPSLSELGF